MTFATSVWNAGCDGRVSEACKLAYILANNWENEVNPVLPIS